MTQVNVVKVTFDEWMSGRQWLGDKAPAEGFYVRYTKDELELMKEAFEQGAKGQGVGYSGSLSENVQYLIRWSCTIGYNLNSK